jgi:hypothetical protein
MVLEKVYSNSKRAIDHVDGSKAGFLDKILYKEWLSRSTSVNFKESRPLIAELACQFKGLKYT